MFGAPRISTKELVSALEGSLGPRLKSAVLYGSVVAGDFDREASDVNLLLVISPLTIAELETIEPHARLWRNDRQAPPRLFTPEQLACSLDAFAIEWHDIHQSRRVLSGVDPFEGLVIPFEPLRMQVERELNALVLALRSGYLRAGGQSKRLRRLMRESVVPILVLCRAALRLFPGEVMVPAVKLEALRALAARLALDLEPIATVFHMRQREANVANVDVPRLFADYLRSAELVLAAVDRVLFHQHSGTGAS